MSSKLLENHSFLRNKRTVILADDFLSYVDGGLWTKSVSHAGAVAVGSTRNGILAIPTGGSPANNDESYVPSTNALFNIVANEPFLMETLVQFTEANTNASAVIVGFADSVAAGLIQNGGLAVKTTGNVIAFFKPKGKTNWQCVVQINGVNLATQDLVTLNANNPSFGQNSTSGLSNYQNMRIEVEPISTTQAEVKFYLGGTDPLSSILVYSLIFTYTNVAIMQAVFGIKAGGANQETLNVDFVAVENLRN